MAATVPLCAGSGSYGGGITRYLPPAVTQHGSSAQFATEAHAQITYRHATTLSNFYVNIVANNRGAGSAGTRVNGADGAQSVSWASSQSGEFEDTSNTDSITAGNQVTYRITTGGGGNAFRIAGVSCRSTAASDTRLRLAATASLAFGTASATRFTPLAGHNVAQATEANVAQEMNQAGTLRNLYVYISGNARGTTTTYVSRVNAADGALTVSVAASQTGVFEDTTNADTISAGDDVCVAVTTGTGTGNITSTVVSTEYVTTGTASQYGLHDPAGFSLSGGQTRFSALVGSMTVNTTEAEVQASLRLAMTVSDLAVYVTANTGAFATTVTLRINAGNGTMSVTIPGGQTGLHETTGSDAVQATDLLDLSYVTGSGSGSITLIWGTVILNVPGVPPAGPAAGLRTLALTGAGI